MNKERSGKEVFMQNQIDMLEGDVERLREELGTVKKEMEEKDEGIVEKDVAIEEKDEEIDALRAMNETLEEKVKGLTAELHGSLRREDVVGGLGGGIGGDSDEEEEGVEGTVKALMEAFNRERRAFQEKNEEVKAQLRRALVDVVYLTKKVEALSKR